MFFQKITEEIKLLRTPFCGSWSGVVLLTGPQTILIDCGADMQAVDDCILPALSREGLVASDIDIILLTHCHGDHVGGLKRMKELSGAEVLVYSGSEDKIQNPLRYSKKIRAKFPEYSPPAPSSLQGTKPDRLLDENATEAGFLRLIHTPGHDDDCVCWYDERSRTLISGDSLQANGTELQGIGFYQNLAAYRSTIQKLKTLPIDNIIPGHHYSPCPPAAVGKEAAKTYLQTCDSLVAEYDRIIREQYNSGITDLTVIARKLIRHVGAIEPAYLFLPLHTVEQHLFEITGEVCHTE